MQQHDSVRNLVELLGENKEAFLTSVNQTIRSYIERQGAECLTIIGRLPSGEIGHTWKLAPNLEYCRCLMAFCQAKQFKGYALDSGLTDPVVELVAKEFESFYQDHNHQIANELTRALARNEAFVNSLTQALVDSVSGVSKNTASIVKQKASMLIADQLQNLLQTGAGEAITATTTKVIAGAIAAPLTASIAAMLLKLLAVHMKTIIIHILSSAAVKAIIATIVKKYVVAALVGGTVKAIAAKLGLSMAGAFAVVLLPLIVAFIAYEVWRFPAHLGKQVADKVMEELGANFAEINEGILLQIVGDLGKSGARELAKRLANEPEIQQSLDELLASLA
jgi:hypothetical protein